MQGPLHEAHSTSQPRPWFEIPWHPHSIARHTVPRENCARDGGERSRCIERCRLAAFAMCRRCEACKRRRRALRMGVRLAVLPDAATTSSDSAKAAAIGSDLECGARASIVWTGPRQRHLRHRPVTVDVAETSQYAESARHSRSVTKSL